MKIAVNNKTGKRYLCFIRANGSLSLSAMGGSETLTVSAKKANNYSIDDNVGEVRHVPRAVPLVITKKQAIASTPRVAPSGMFPDAAHVSAPKPVTIRSLKLLEEVRVLPCQNCGKPGPSEASHRNVGKGMGLKTDDLCAALCHDCHAMIDQKLGGIERDQADHLWLISFYKTVKALVKVKQCSLDHTN